MTTLRDFTSEPEPEPEPAPVASPGTERDRAPDAPDEWFCPWCGSMDIRVSLFGDGFACNDCEAIQPTTADWYPELIR